MGYKGDMSHDVPDEELPPLGDILLDADVIGFMQQNYPTKMKADISKQTRIILKYFHPELLVVFCCKLDPGTFPPAPLPQQSLHFHFPDEPAKKE